MQIRYDETAGLLYRRLNERKQPVCQQADEKIVGSEILDASRPIDLKTLLSLPYEVSP